MIIRFRPKVLDKSHDTFLHVPPKWQKSLTNAAISYGVCSLMCYLIQVPVGILVIVLGFENCDCHKC